MSKIEEDASNISFYVLKAEKAKEYVISTKNKTVNVNIDEGGTEMNYCTLFDSNYLDKGIAMIDSLKRVSLDSVVFVLCMDENCYNVLFDYYRDEVRLIKLNEFMDDKLAALKVKRSRAEFCWSCTARLIKYVLESGIEICTYVDSDLYFFSDPICLIDEMRSHDCCVQVISHNFPIDSRLKNRINTVGKYCVQFNTFTNCANALRLLEIWIEQCDADCSVDNGGDQKYTDEWDKYDFVNVSKNLGAGVAPWNIERFKGEESCLYDRYSRKNYSLVFYHFQNVINKQRYSVSIEPLYHSLIIDKRLVCELYLPYIKELETIKRKLEERYGIVPLVNKYTEGKKGYSNSFLSKARFFISIPLKRKKSILLNKILKISRRKIAEVNTEIF